MAKEKGLPLFKKSGVIADTARLGAILCNVYDTVYELGLNTDTLYIVSAKDGVVEKTAVGSISGCLKSIKDAVLYSEEDAKKFFDALSLKKLDPLRNKELVEYVECRIKAPGGGYRWRSYLAHATKLDNPDERTCILCVKDINDSKKHEEMKNRQVSDALVAAEVASKAKTELVNRISHEVRTPLASIIGYCEFLKPDMVSPQTKDYLEKILYSAKHILQIADDIRDLPLVEQGLSRVVHASFDLKEFVTTLAAIFYTQAHDKKQAFDITLTDVSEEYVVGDSFKLNQILIKLLSNAIKYTPEGGRVMVNIAQTGIDEDKIHLRFTVTDTGIGMSEELTARATKPFEQGDNSGGSGLGLAIAKNLIDLMGGTLEINSKLDVGTTVTVDLSFDRDMEQTIDDAASENFNDLNVIVVDDEQTSGEYLALLFENCNVNCTYAQTSDAAVEAVKRLTAEGKKVDMVIIDWLMHDTPAAETIRTMSVIANVKPIYIASAFDVAATEKPAQKAGVKSVIGKPVFQSTVANLLLTTFGRKKTATEVKTGKLFTGQGVLLVEDNEMNAEIAAQLLTNSGLVVTVAGNGQDALIKFVSAPAGSFAAILMDIKMPVMDGYEATRQIRASRHPDAKKIPIIAMTADVFAEDVSLALAAGMQNHIPKPVDVNLFYNILMKYVK